MKFKYVVLIDDDPAVNYYHKYMIEGADFTDNILVGQSIEEALEILMEFQEVNDIDPSLVVLDVNMPKYNGFEFVMKYYDIFQELRRRNVMIIFLTTSRNPSDIDKASQLDVISDYKQKPMTESMLMELKDVVNKANSQ